MPNFESGVPHLYHTQATVDVFFPMDAKGNADVRCCYCKFFRTASSSCALNNEMCFEPRKYVGEWCPLRPKEDD